MSELESRRGTGLRVWDFPTRLSHWLLVAAIAAAFLSSDEDSVIAPWHQAAGWLAAVLIVFRVVWGLVGGEHARFADFLRPGRIAAHLKALASRRPDPELGHNPIGGLAILGLLGLTGATIATGVAMLASAGENELHEVFAYALLALIGVHVVAVVAMSIASRENLVRAMITGVKPAARHPGGHDAKPAPATAYGLAAVALIAAALAAIRIDPQAFGPHSRAEAGEAREGGEGASDRETPGHAEEHDAERAAGRN